MAKTEWHIAINKMMQNVVKVSIAGGGYGSGVIVPNPKNTASNCCVLTAYHVIQKAEETGATIVIELANTRDKIELPSLLRTIFTAKDRDQALILFNGPEQFGKPREYQLLPENNHYVPGVEFGWLGYPSLEIAEDTVCFLHGRVSAYIDKYEAYLVDGASIHGVSGGPVFCCGDNGTVVLAGIVTNYYPNNVSIQNTGVQAWPGLAMFRTVNPLIRLYSQANTKTSLQLPQVGPVLGNAKES